jgi:hypothetical protein
MAQYRHRGSRSFSRDIGREIARQHVEEARRLSQELGGTDEDVKQYFFAVPQAQLNRILNLYEVRHGQQARQYAQQTIRRWRTGERRMSGLVASRLFNLLPPLMPLEDKYRLITNLWHHVGPSSKKILRVGLDANIDDVLLTVKQHMDEVVVRYAIPDNLERRFNWLSAGDAHVKQNLLNHLRHMEKSLVVEGARAQLPVLLAHLQSEQGNHTHRLAQILQIGKHELELAVDKKMSGVVLVDRVPIESFGSQLRNNGNWKWLWWVLGIIILFGVLARGR